MSTSNPNPSLRVEPRGGPQVDELVRTISKSGGVAVKAMVGSGLVAEALSMRLHAPTAGNALGRAMLGAVLIAVGSSAEDADESNVESVQVQIRGNGPLGVLTAIADSRARVRGTVQHPTTQLIRDDGTPDIANAVGHGPLNVVRHRPRWRSPYTGTVPLVSGEIAGDLTLYLTESEQTPSAMGLGVAFGSNMADVAAAGFLVQAMPGAAEEDLARVEQNVAALPGLATLLEDRLVADDLIDRVLDGLGSRERHAMQPTFYCPCTRERAARTLALLDRSELGEIRNSESGQEVVCDFCARAYQISGSEVEALIDSLDADAG